MTEQAVLDIRVKLAYLHALFLKSSAHTLVYCSAYHGHYRNKYKYHQGQPDIYSSQYNKRRRYFNTRDEKFLGAVVRKLGYIKEVVCNSAHNLSDLGIVIIGVGQHLQVSVCVAAHIGFNLRPHYMTLARHIIVCKAVDYTKRQIQKTQPCDCFDREACDIGKSGIRNIPDNHRQHNFAHSGEQCAEQIYRKSAFVRLKVRHHSSYKIFGLIIFIIHFPLRKEKSSARLL